MPYIQPKLRSNLDAKIDALASAIVDSVIDHNNETAYAGVLNYCITRLVMQVINKNFVALRYGIIATVTGVLKNVSDEFYRRVAVPYEDAQIVKNGDVDVYADFNRDIKPASDRA